jgi:hypothetical protein
MVYINERCAVRAKDIIKIWIKKELHEYIVNVVTDPILGLDSVNQLVIYKVEGSYDKSLSQDERDKNRREAESRAQACMERIINQIDFELNVKN